MEYIIYGAGKLGALALDFLGHPRVNCFVDSYKKDQKYCEKSVIDSDTLFTLDLENKLIVIASEKYWMDMEKQLKEHNILRYFVFKESHLGLWTQLLPNYYLNRQFELVSYNRILSVRKICAYKKIAILGVNELLPYLIAEIAMQNSINSVSEIITFDEIEYQTVGIPCSNWEHANKDFDCLLINCGRYQKECPAKLEQILEQVSENAEIIDLYDVDCVEPSFRHPELVKYKDIYKGKRIFLIGNGPSMKLEDLERLQQNNEICIACNKIYRIYEKTTWRPDYIVFSDYNVIWDCLEDIPKIAENVILADNYNYYNENPYFDSVQYIHYFFGGQYPIYTRFSEDICNGVYCGYSVMYDIGLQLAAYMGASEIYLLGIDNSATANLTDAQNHFISDYYRQGEEKKYEGLKFEKEKAEKAYMTAERYSGKKGFRIYNATRGGALEVFERVNFDDLF